MKQYSPLAADLWDVYAREFLDRWGMDKEVSAIIGARSKQLFSAEFLENGVATYSNSVVLPIRNAFYAASQMHERWEVLKNMELKEPILDYGCGVGMQLLWLRKQGFTNLYGYELEGVQCEIMRSVFKKHGIGEWLGKPVETILCTNVLEHVAKPLQLLDNLFLIGKRVIANVCVDHDSSHIASHEDLDKCRDILEKRETLYRAA